MVESSLEKTPDFTKLWSLKFRTMKKGLLLLSAMFLSFGIMAQTIYPDYMDGVIWVKLKNDYNPSIKASMNSNHVKYDLDKLPFQSILQQHDITSMKQPFFMVDDLRLKNMVRIEFADYANVDALISSLKGNGSVEYAEKAPLLKKTLTPNDPSYSPSTMWGLYQVQAGSALLSNIYNVIGLVHVGLCFERNFSHYSEKMERSVELFMHNIEMKGCLC